MSLGDDDMAEVTFPRERHLQLICLSTGVGYGTYLRVPVLHLPRSKVSTVECGNCLTN